MANLNYKGSLAEERMRFRSTTDVKADNSTDIFNTVSVYVPSSVAKGNIVDWSNVLISNGRPAVFQVDANNFTDFMEGELLIQWLPAFKEGANFSLSVVLIVFDDTKADGWKFTPSSISYKPLTDAFNALYAMSYMKVLFYPAYDGKPMLQVLPQDLYAQADISLSYNTSSITVPDGEFRIKDLTNNEYKATIPTGYVVPLDGNIGDLIEATASNNGATVGYVVGDILSGTGELSALGLGKNVFAEVMEITPATTNTSGVPVPNKIKFGIKQALSTTIEQGVYELIAPASKGYSVNIQSPTVLRNGAVAKVFTCMAVDAGEETSIAVGSMFTPTDFMSNLPKGVSAEVTALNNVANNPTPTELPSKYFDLSLAMALLCLQTQHLSWFMSLVNITYDKDKQAPNESDICHIRYAKAGDQLEAVTTAGGIHACDRSKYYWACLFKMNCKNTSVLVHSEPVYIIGEILGAYFEKTNGSGTFIGNKLSLLRLSGANIKPLGWASWINSMVNENDDKGHQQLRDMNIGFLQTISDKTVQDCELSMMRGVGQPNMGIPMSMHAISKFVDYTASMEVADFITDKGTLTKPVMTDEQAYKRIQGIVLNTLGRFAATNGRVMGITMQFPSFNQAKISKTALSASSAWKAIYKDDLDTVNVSGGIVAE